MSQRIARVLLALGALAVFAAPGNSTPQALAGRWATPGLGSVVELRSCDSDAAKLCGRIVWLWQELDEAGRSRTDAKNPDPAARRRPLLGVEIVTGLRELSPGVWGGAELYNPDDGRRYTGAIRLRGSQLQLRGCALRVFCQTQIWRRPAELIAELGGNQP